MQIWVDMLSQLSNGLSSPDTLSRERGGIHADRNHPHLPVSRSLLPRSLSPFCGRFLGQLPDSSCVSGVHRSHLHHRWVRPRCHTHTQTSEISRDLAAHSSFTPTHLSLCPYMCLPGAVQSYTWSLTYTVTTAGGSTPEAGQQLSCMRSSAPVPPPSSTHRMPVYTHREEHG